ncbi:MAG: xanthine dehydrogenase family protein subunit M [Pirellulaceae bacterium]
MREFSYAAPTTLAEAARLVAGAGGRAKILAGGTDILVQLREGLREADLVVDVKKIPELAELSYSREQGLRLGASVPCYRIYDHQEIVQAYSALVDAAKIIGGWQIQSRASVGGNLCNASPAGDTIPALIAHGVACVVVGPNGSRELPAAEFCVAPGRNALQPGEILVTLVFPPPAARASSAYERFIPRNEMDIAVAGAGSWLQLSTDGSQIEAARVAVCAIAPTPKFAAEASAWLAGQPATEATFAQAGELAKKVAAPITDMRGTAEYRTHLVGVLVKRTLAKAAQRARAL